MYMSEIVEFIKEENNFWEAVDYTTFQPPRRGRKVTLYRVTVIEWGHPIQVILKRKEDYFVLYDIIR